MKAEPGALAEALEAVYAAYSRDAWVGSDPLDRVVRYPDAADREVVAFIAAGLSFGGVGIIQGSIERALAPLGEHPAQTLRQLTGTEARRLAQGFNHRWVFAEDLANVYLMLGRALVDAGGLEPLFAAGMRADAEDVRPGAASLVAALGARLDPGARERRGTRAFLSDPAGSSASKRLHMYLRWMIRHRDVDLGLWRSARPAQLLMPLDTHIARIAGYLGLTRRRTAGLGMVLDITHALRRVDPIDPIRFDFALCRLGILDHCPVRLDDAACARCALLPVCGRPVR
ncbi:MAG: TIGR02757 family protein [Deltaproteobacteria bacterium]|nr:TIGR02757 family protein [Deltaproteobacteria bacterium]